MGKEMITNFRDYWVNCTPDEKQRLAQACGLSNETMLSNIAHGRARAGIKTIASLQRADPMLTMEFMRPDLVQPERKAG